MKMGKKIIIFWIASLTLFSSAWGVAKFFPEWLSGVRGTFICFFLGYCGIIVVAQAFAFVEIFRRQRQNHPEKSRHCHTEIGST